MTEQHERSPAEPIGPDPPISREIEMSDDNGKGPTITTTIRRLLDLEIDSERLTLFHTPGGKPYASIKSGSNGCRNTFPVKSVWFGGVLRDLYASVETVRLPPSQALHDVSGYAEYRAFVGPSAEVFCRVAHQGGTIWLDLGNDAREVVKVTSDEWSIVRDCPVYFERPAAMKALPRPVSGGNLETLLTKFLNVSSGADYADRKLLVAWLLSTLQPDGAYPILRMSGVEGSSKSCTAKLLRSCIDPNDAPLQKFPSSQDDLLLTLTKSHIGSFDNLSHMDQDRSDLLCTIATGNALPKRKLYSDEDLVILKVRKPLILNGIPNIATQVDLIDRSIAIELPRITPEKRKTEDQFWGDFSAAHPQILGAILDTVVEALRNLPNAPKSSLPRMADFARWIVAAEQKLGWPKTKDDKSLFLSIFEANIDAAKQHSLDACPVVAAIRRLIENKTEWKGTATELLETLNLSARAHEARHPEWPRSANKLSETLTRLESSLEQAALTVTRNRDGKQRTITIEKS
jgi:putative DNA primase/helicase